MAAAQRRMGSTTVGRMDPFERYGARWKGTWYPAWRASLSASQTRCKSALFTPANFDVLFSDEDEHEWGGCGRSVIFTHADSSDCWWSVAGLHSWAAAAAAAAESCRWLCWLSVARFNQVLVELNQPFVFSFAMSSQARRNRSYCSCYARMSVVVPAVSSRSRYSYQRLFIHRISALVPLLLFLPSLQWQLRRLPALSLLLPPSLSLRPFLSYTLMAALGNRKANARVCLTR